MISSRDTDIAKKRTRELFDFLNEGDLDSFLVAYSDTIRFTLPARPQSPTDVGMASGDGKAALRGCIETMHRTCAPFRLLDVFGPLASRSVALEDALGNRLLMTVETDSAGLTSNVFAMRTRTGLQLAA